MAELQPNFISVRLPFMHRYVLSGLMWLSILPALGQQVEADRKDPQNIKIDPQNTDCHQLPESFEQTSEALTAIGATRFYYDESIRTTRKSGLMQARFVSCDFKKGFLIVRFDGVDQVFPAVELEVWEQFQATADIDGYYLNKIRSMPMID